MNDAESKALDFLLGLSSQNNAVACDSKIALTRLKNPNAQHLWPSIWTTDQADRDRLKPVWTKGHLTKEEHATKHGAGFSWAWEANRHADWLCGQKANEILSQEHVAKVKQIDSIAREVSTFLGKRAEFLLANCPLPSANEVKFERKTRAKGETLPKKGPNKKQILLLAVKEANPQTMHNWKVSSGEGTNNLCIRCEGCGLYVQQVDPLEVVEHVLNFPCQTLPVPTSNPWSLHASHTMINLGESVVCKTCGVFQSVRILKAKPGCQGRCSQVCKKPNSRFQEAQKRSLDPKAGVKAFFGMRPPHSAAVLPSNQSLREIEAGKSTGELLPQAPPPSPLPIPALPKPKAKNKTKAKKDGLTQTALSFRK